MLKPTIRRTRQFANEANMIWLRMLFCCAVFLLSSTDSQSHAGGGPQNLALIVNPNDPNSLAVANCYVELREVPPCNVIYIPWTVDVRATSGAQFRDRILAPALKEMEQRGIAGQIDYLVFSSGYPYLVDFVPVFKGQTFPPQGRPTASLTAAAYLYQFVLGSSPNMFASNANLYYAPNVGGISRSRAFSSREHWKPNGEPAATGGMKYLLSTALGVTHGRGNSVDEIIASLRRAKAADGSKPKGTIYYMRNNDVRSKVRHDLFPAAVKELTAIGVKAEILNGTVPTGKPDVMGITSGTPHLRLQGSNCTLLPGALVDNLTSAGGQMLIRQEDNPQTRISEFIRYGAAGASGTVVEPYAIPAKFPTPDLHVHYARGCSLAEAFYRSVSGPSQLLIIGDPLCQPWAVAPKVLVEGIKTTEALQGSVTLRPRAEFSDARQAFEFQVFIDGVRTGTLQPGTNYSWDTTKAADGWHHVRVVAIDNTPIAVQGAWDELVQVKNGKESIPLLLTESPRVAMGAAFQVRVTSSLKSPVRILSNHRQLATIAQGTGVATLDSNQLGKGRVQLVAEQTGTPSLQSRPIVVEIY